MQKTTAMLAVAAVVILAIAGAGAILLTGGDESEKRYIGTITDGAGREVVVPDSLDRGIVTFGSNDPLRFLSYFNVDDKVIEVDKGDVTDPRNGRAYSYAYDYGSLPFHSDNTIANEDVERVGRLNPSLIVVQNGLYSSAKSNVDALAARTCVVVLHSIPTPIWNSDYVLGDEFAAQLDMLGKVLGKEKRAEDLLNGVNGIMKDIRNDIGGKTASDKVYVAGVTWQGSNSLNATFPTYAPLLLVDGVNAYAGSTTTREILTVEQVAQTEKTVVVIDPSSSDKILGNTGSQGVMRHIFGLNSDSDAGNDVRIYTVPPIVWDSTNYDCVFAAAYYLEHLIYGIGDTNSVNADINNLFRLFYGDAGGSVLNDMSVFFEGKSGANGVDLPLMHEVRIVQDGDEFTFVRV